MNSIQLQLSLIKLFEHAERVDEIVLKSDLWITVQERGNGCSKSNERLDWPKDIPVVRERERERVEYCA
jgi:hypothetical protein